eukprot:551551_1
MANNRETTRRSPRGVKRVDYSGFNEKDTRSKPLTIRREIRNRKRKASPSIPNRNKASGPPRKKKKLHFTHRKSSRQVSPQETERLEAERAQERRYFEDIKSTVKELKKQKHQNMKHADLISKYEMIKIYYYDRINSDLPKMDIYQKLCDLHDRSRPTIKRYLDEYEMTHRLKVSLRGNHAKAIPGLNSIQDKLKFRHFIDGKIKAKKHFNLDDVTKFANDLLRDQVAERGSRFCSETVSKWMLEAGYFWGRHQKGIYIDGHERKDVLVVCISFVFRIL